MRDTIPTVPPPYAAFLRVYEPLSAFPPSEQDGWRRYVASGRIPRRAEGLRTEHEHSQRRMLSGRLPDPGDHAFVMERGPGMWVCPWRTSLRAWEAAERFAEGLGEELAEAFLPPEVTDRARADLAGWRTVQPDVRSHILSATWAVPLRWFVLFGTDERWLSMDGGQRELVYVTEMSQARRRAARALPVLRRGLGETAMAEGLEELARWLEEFHPRSVVELDYGGLVWLFEPAALDADDSVADVAAALGALRIGDAPAAEAAYDRVSARWRPAHLYDRCN